MTLTFKFIVGDRVQLIRDPKFVGVVENAFSYESQPNYYVRWDESCPGGGTIGYIDEEEQITLVIEPEVLKPTDFVGILCEGMTTIPPGGNPFIHDSERSGLSFHAGWTIMYRSSQPVLNEMILINSDSGQRIKLSFLKHKNQPFLGDTNGL